MQMNLTEMRARTREDLQDTDPATYHWTNHQVDEAIQRCVEEYSMAAPIEQLSDIPTTADQAELDITPLTDMLSIESIEFPIDQRPPRMQRFTFWADRAFMEDEGDGEDARVKWLRSHDLTAVSTTIPGKHQEIIILGATGYLAMSRAAYTVDRASIAGRYGTLSYRVWGIERLERYDRKLKEISRRRRLVQGMLYINE